VLASACALVVPVALAVPAAALGASSPRTREQVGWVRRAASNFVSDELRGDGAGACSILSAPLQGAQRNHTCAQR
jgi:hypothetical protein